MNELMESQETIQRNAKLINLVFNAAKEGEPITIVARSSLEQTNIFNRAKELLLAQRIPFSSGIDAETNYFLTLQNGENILFTLPAVVVAATMTQVDESPDAPINIIPEPVRRTGMAAGIGASYGAGRQVAPATVPAIERRPDAPIFRAIPTTPEEFDHEENKLLAALTELRANKPGNGSRPTAKPAAGQIGAATTHPLMQSVGQILNQSKPAEEVAKNRSALDDLVTNEGSPGVDMSVQGAITRPQATMATNHPNNKKQKRN